MLLVFFLGISITSNVFSQTTAISEYGRLKVVANHLCDANGQPIQLRGMSSHGLQWYGLGDCVTGASLDALADDWQSGIFRVSMYVDEGGYKTDPAGYRAAIDTIVDDTLERGMYVILDWHILNPGDPWENIEDAREFFSYMSAKYGGKGHVLYELCNEPNGVAWSRIKTYAEDVIPLIRANDPDGIIIVGTPAWSSFGISEGRDPMEIVNNPLSGADAHNLMYAFHFYAASHKSDYLSKIRNIADYLPIFVTEWGTQTYSGDGANDVQSSQQWIDLMAEKKISWTNWNFSDDWRSGAVLKTGACPSGPWTGTGLKESGQLVLDWVRNGSGRQNNKIVVGYFPAWGIYSDYFVRDIDPSKITHINYGFINVKDNRPVIGVTKTGVGDAWADYQRGMSAAESVDGVGDTWDQPLKGNWNQLRKLKQRNPHIKVLAVLGGWTWSGGFSDAALPENREAFVADCIDKLILGNLPYDTASSTGGSGAAAGVFDGIDIDWEYPVCCGLGGNTYRPQDKENYTALLAEFRKQLDQIDPGLLLTIAAPAGPHNIINHEPDQFPQYVDFINLMTYDFHGSWDSSTGHLAPMYPASDDPFARPGWSVDETVRTYRDEYGIPKDKLVLGLPFYGRSWSGVSPGADGDGLYQSATGAGPGERGEPGMLFYSTIAQTYEPAYSKYYHTEAKVPWLYNGTDFITYDDAATISTKAQYILQQGLAGAMFWNLMSDVKGNPAPANSLLSALWDGLGGTVPTYQCGDGIDNDGDGLVDLQDPGCTNAGDNDETDEPPPTTQCSDGLDNDGDGLIDLADPGCEAAEDNDETNDPPQNAQCGDGIDNDGDGLIDLADPGCENADDNDETNSLCGKVATETVIQDDWDTGYCANVMVTNNTCDSVVWQVSVGVEGTVGNLWNGEYTQHDGAIQVRGAAWNSELTAGQSTSFGFCAKRDQAPVQYQCSDGVDNDGDGLVDLQDPGCVNGEDNDEYNKPAPTTQCSDGVDNDGDGLVDLNDPGCANAEDNDEHNGVPAKVVAKVQISDDWGTGYCANVTITNNGTEDVDWRVTLNVEGNVRSLWGGLYEKNGDQLTLEGKAWNNIVSAGSTLSSIGFCADR